MPCGTTGESPTLSHAEHKRVVETCIDQVKKRVVVIAGSGSNNTAEALELTKHAEGAGADAALMITPYYNKPTQEGLYQHYKTVASQTKIPIVVYNVPGRTSLNLLPETMARLAETPQYRGPQGCHRRFEAGVQDPGVVRRQDHRALRGRFHYAAADVRGRYGGNLRGLQRGARRHGGDVQRLLQRRPGQSQGCSTIRCGP